LLDDLAEATLDGTRKEHMEFLVTVPLLILDDLGMRKLPLTAAEELLEIIMRRYERASTMLTSNRGAVSGRAWRSPKLVSHEQVLVLADYALYQAKGSGRNRAVGLLPAGETVRDGTVAATIYIDGIPASPVTTLASAQQAAAAGAE
jgi:predicted signal transduction protein with EAL and GGDEF domain